MPSIPSSQASSLPLRCHLMMTSRPNRVYSHVTATAMRTVSTVGSKGAAKRLAHPPSPFRSTLSLTPSTAFSSNTPSIHFGHHHLHYSQQVRSTGSVDKAQGRVMILGSGWGGFKLLRDMNKNAYKIVAVSPRNHFLFTPLLASTSVGTLEFRCVTEPVRDYTRNVEYHQAWCDTVDFDNQIVNCTPNLSKVPAMHTGAPDGKQVAVDDIDKVKIDYDHLIIAVGGYSNTFNIPGVKEHAFFLKEIVDARRIRLRVLQCFERAEMAQTADEKNGLLHFAVVGGGPTGVEFSAELHDFIREDCARLFPGLMSHVTVAVYDVGSTLLANFDKSLSEYCMTKFRREGIDIKTRTVIERVEDGKLVLKDGNEVPFGCLVWSTGLTENPLTAALEGKVLKSKSKRILTDAYLRVLDTDGKVIPKVYALGDCGTIKDNELPQTAQVANQQAIWLRKALNKLARNPEKSMEEITAPFSFRNLGSMAYIGNMEAVVDLTKVNETAKNSGRLAWVFWRSSYLSMSVSTRNKMLIPMYWFLTFVFGRDVTSFQEYDLRKRAMNLDERAP